MGSVHALQRKMNIAGALSAVKLPSGAGGSAIVPAMGLEYLMRHAFPHRDMPADVRRWRVQNVRGVLRGAGRLLVAKAMNMPLFYPQLNLAVRRAGEDAFTYYGLASVKLIVDNGVAFLVDDWDNNGTDLTNLNFHGIGTNSTAEAQTDSALGAESTTALNPDSTRATGTRSQPAANQYRTVGTLTADAQILVREHGIFSQAATGGGTLWDRSVFALITLENLDSIQTTYTATVSAGG